MDSRGEFVAFSSLVRVDLKNIFLNLVLDFFLRSVCEELTDDSGDAADFNRA